MLMRFFYAMIFTCCFNDATTPSGAAVHSSLARRGNMDEMALPAEEMQGVAKIVLVQGELGLHARPAAKLAQTAQQFHSRITLEYDDMVADAKSILDILSLAAGRGASLTLRCTGEDAVQAAESLEALFAHGQTER